jgi:uncharacterized protein YndB with AHSA1/START domain
VVEDYTQGVIFNATVERTKEPNMPDIFHEHTFAAPPERLHDAITTEDGLAAFWTDQTTAEPVVGSTATFVFGPDAHTRFDMRIDAIQPDRVDWTCTDGPDEWRGTRLRWLLTPADGGTKLRFEHLGWESTDGAVAMCSYTWAMILDRLERYLATGQPQPLFDIGARTY